MSGSVQSLPDTIGRSDFRPHASFLFRMQLFCWTTSTSRDFFINEDSLKSAIRTLDVSECLAAENSPDFE
ncbi:hypothetical protein J6590_084743 [Homalodisca vitripennis]|nr:hypothetical protein J6590_084743 [Homalodisca vitripennis]